MKPKLIAFALLCALAVYPAAFAQAPVKMVLSSGASASCGATNCFTVQLPASTGAVGVQITSVGSTFSATVSFFGSADGQNFVAIYGAPVAGGSSVASTTTAGLWQFSTSGLGFIRAVSYPYSSGQIQVLMNRSTAALAGTVSITGGTSSNFGASLPASGTAVGALVTTVPPTYTNGQMLPLTLTTKGAQRVTLFDTSGNEVTPGGGTQYATGAAHGTSTGTFAMVDDGTYARSIPSDTSGHPFLNLWGYGGTAVGAGNAIDVKPGTAAVFHTILDSGISTDAADGAVMTSNPVPFAGKLGTDSTRAAIPVFTAGGIGSTRLFDSGGTEISEATGHSVKISGIGSAGSAATGVVTVQGIASMTPLFTNIYSGANANATGYPVYITGSGTAGSAATNPVTVQGIASMTPILTSGTGTAGSAATGVATIQGITGMTPVVVAQGTADPADQGVRTNPPAPVAYRLSTDATKNAMPIADANGVTSSNMFLAGVTLSTANPMPVQFTPPASNGNTFASNGTADVVIAASSTAASQVILAYRFTSSSTANARVVTICDGACSSATHKWTETIPKEDGNGNGYSAMSSFYFSSAKGNAINFTCIANCTTEITISVTTYSIIRP